MEKVIGLIGIGLALCSIPFVTLLMMGKIPDKWPWK